MKRPAIAAALLAGTLAVLFVATGHAGPKRVARRQPAPKSAATKQKANSKAGQPAKKESAPPPAAQSTSDKAPLKQLFRDWPQPRLTLVFSGDIAGYIEPCGCTGRENQKGGLQRRHSFLKKLSADGWNPVAFDVGGFISRSGEQSFLKLETAVKSLKVMGYQAMTFGKVDWSFDAARKFSIISEINPDEGDRPFIAANVAVFKSDVPPRFRIFEAAGYKIGVTAVLGDGFHDAVAATVDTDDLGLTKAAEALASVVPELEDCDLKILLSHAPPDESRALAAKFPQFQFVATASGGADEPPLELEMLAGKKSRLVEVGKKGMYVIAIGLFDDPRKPVRYEVVPLDSRWIDSTEMIELMAEYQEKLQIGGWDALQLSREPHPRSELLGEFVGSAACQDCHEEAYKIWEGSKHSHATESLAHLTPARHFDPECVSCHATGWKPQAFSPLAGGYDGLETTPQLTGNGCENCHGPGGAHRAAENAGTDEELQEKLRAALHLDKIKARNDVCIKCHDGDNDPFFGHPDEEGNDTYLTKYWAEIAH